MNAHAGLLWYADALGRVARTAGVTVFARQTIFGGSYGLLDNSTYLPTPGYWVALLHKRLMGRRVLNVTSPLQMSSVPVYAHCARRMHSGIVLMIVNFGSQDVRLTMPITVDPIRRQWILTSGGGLLSNETLLNGEGIVVNSSGVVPKLLAQNIPNVEELALPGESATFVSLNGTVPGLQLCGAVPWQV